MPIDPTNLQRWRLILGKQAEDSLSSMGQGASLTGDQAELDEALDAIYAGDDNEELTKEDWASDPKIGSPGSARRGSGFPKVAKWLDQIRTFFPKDVVVLLQKDAIERRGLKQLLLEPEVLASVEPSLDLAATVLAMKNMVPEKAKAAARELVKKVVDDIRKQLESHMVQAIRGALARNRHNGFRSLPNLDFPRTLRKNLKNYNPDLGTLIPQHLAFFSRQQRQNQWNIIIAMDQSGSMHSSLIYGGIMGAILASIPAVETHVVAFNHQDVVDLTELCADPVDLLFGIQLSGAEDYWKATTYCERFMHTPAKTLYILLADLHDTSPNTPRFLKKMEHLLESGIKAVTLLAITDQGKPSYNESLANKLATLGMPSFACTPNHLPQLLAAVLRGSDLKTIAKNLDVAANAP